MCVHCKVRHPEYVGIGAETHEQKWPYNMFAPQFTWKITKSTFFLLVFATFWWTPHLSNDLNLHDNVEV